MKKIEYIIEINANPDELSDYYDKNKSSAENKIIIDRLLTPTAKELKEGETTLIRILIPHFKIKI